MRASPLIALFLSAITTHAQTCTPTATQQAAAQTLTLQHQLLSTSVPDMDTDVPIPLRPILHNFKQSLIATVDTALRCNNPDPSQLQSNFATLLHANLTPKPDVPYDPSDKTQDHTEIYGNALNIAVKPIPHQLNLYSIQLTYGIECGDDNILLLYRRTPTGYHRELLWQNPDLNSTGDAVGDMYLFPLVPPDPAHPYLVAIIHGTPWCTSNMSIFHIDLLAPSAADQPQHLLAHIGQHFRREDDPHLRITPDGFDLRVTADDLAGSTIMRPGVFRYRTSRGALERVQPIALNSWDFVDEWLQLPWSQAAQWSAVPTAELKSSSDRFDYSLHPADGDAIDSYGPTYACKRDPNTFQIQINVMTGKDGRGSAKLYAQVRQNPNSFTMLSITPTPDPTCTGPNLMPH